MATKKKAPTREKQKAKGKKRLKKSDSAFYKIVGSLGGRATKSVQGKEFFSRIAKLSHAPGVRSGVAPEPEPKARAARRPSKVAGRGAKKASAGA